MRGWSAAGVSRSKRAGSAVGGRPAYNAASDRPSGMVQRRPCQFLWSGAEFPVDLEAVYPFRQMIDGVPWRYTHQVTGGFNWIDVAMLEQRADGHGGSRFLIAKFELQQPAGTLLHGWRASLQGEHQLLHRAEASSRN